MKKPVWVPARSAIHLGFLLDSIRLSVYLSTDKLEKIETKCMLVRKYASKILIREVARLVGSMNTHCFDTKWGEVNVCSIEKSKNVALKLANRKL